MKRNQTRRLTLAAMMGAVSFVLMYFSFSVPVLSPFASFDLSALPDVTVVKVESSRYAMALMSANLFGNPSGAVEIIAVKVLLKLVFKGTSSMFTGEIQKFLLCTAYALPAVLYYQKHRTKRGAAVGLLLGSVAGVIVAILTNVFLIFPAYMALYGMDWAAIVQMCTAVNPWITNVPTMVAFSIIPFNIISFSVTSILAMLLYKKISVPLKKFAQNG